MKPGEEIKKEAESYSKGQIPQMGVMRSKSQTSMIETALVLAYITGYVNSTEHL